jgi:hypothetical protein
MRHDRYDPQFANLRRQQECARTAYYADRKGDEQFSTQSHLYLAYLLTWRNTHCRGSSIPGCKIWNQRCGRRDAFYDQRIAEVPELVMATGFPALITPAVCREVWSGFVRDDKAEPDTAMPATSAATTILRWVDRSAL